MSGYVLALVYSDRLNHGLASREFITLRLIRFYPIYLVGHMLGTLRSFALLISNNPDTRFGLEWGSAFVLGLFMLPVPGYSGNLFPMNVPAWTLFLELGVNVLFAFGMFRFSNAALAAIMLASATVLAVFTGPPLLFDVGYSGETFLLGVARLERFAI